MPHASQRSYVREVLRKEVSLRARGSEIVPLDDEDPDGPSARYRAHMNSDGSPSAAVAEDFVWQPGTELAPHDRS
jgi:hypothetical protein